MSYYRRELHGNWDDSGSSSKLARRLIGWRLGAIGCWVGAFDSAIFTGAGST